MTTTTIEIIEDSEECVPLENLIVEIPTENLTVQKSLSILAEVVVLGTLIFSLGYVEEEDEIPLSSLMKEAKKKRVAHKQDTVLEVIK